MFSTIKFHFHVLFYGYLTFNIWSKTFDIKSIINKK